MTSKSLALILLLGTGSALAAGTPCWRAPRPGTPAPMALRSTWDRWGQDGGGWHNWGHGGWSAYGQGDYWGHWDW